MSKIAWVLTGDGINCESESADACRRAGFRTEIFHLAELMARPRALSACSLLVLPGGFSFGDELGSGRVLALKIKHQLGWDLAAFAAEGGLVLGICNGFQTLVALGAFGSGLALAANEDGRFRNEWVTLEVTQEHHSVFLDGIAQIDLPIRHGEGRLLFSDERAARPSDAAATALVYSRNPNGSTASIAGLVDSTGRIFGLMPHPEAFARRSQHPGYYRDPGHPSAPGDGLRIFENAFAHAKEVSV